MRRFPAWRYRVSVSSSTRSRTTKVSIAWLVDRLRIENRCVATALSNPKKNERSYIYLDNHINALLVPVVQPKYGVSYYRSGWGKSWHMVDFWHMVDAVGRAGGNVRDSVERVHEGEFIYVRRKRFTAVPDGEEFLLGREA